jgi:3-phenylpropionate/cinnamic acid dioxygenase small subunit
MVMRVLDNIHCSPGRGLATTYHVAVSSSEGYEIQEFLAMEAFFVDHGRYEEWASLLARNVTYRSPAQLFSAAHANESRSDVLCDYDYDFLISYAQKLGQAATDVSRLRRCISNVIVATGPAHREFTVGSYLLITGTHGTGSESIVFTAERHDVLQRCRNSFRIVRREVTFDLAAGRAARLARLI